MSTTQPQARAQKTAPPQCLVKDLRKGNQVDQVFLVENSNFKQTRDNKFFIQADLRDRTGSIKAIRWEADRKLFESFRPDDFVKVNGRVEEFQRHLQIVVDNISKVDDSNVKIESFLPVTEHDIPSMERELAARVDEIGNPHLKRLLETFLADEEVRHGLRRCPAGKTLHHATIGGLLEHITSLVRAADLLCQNYPQLDRDLLLTGIVLHDIGKIRELSYSRTFAYTDLGQLVGHTAIGIAWVIEKGPDVPPDLLTQVLHLIASHHGEAEYGAVKPPMTREAVALNYLDNIDAKLAILDTTAREQQLGGESIQKWSTWHPAMGRRLYFP